MRELLLPLGVLLILGSMLLPLPPVVLDILLIGNLILSFILFIGTVLIAEPLKLSAFPTILLLVTLYRLSLNVSTTRLILSGKSAGEAVEAFGSIVVGGNLVVGIVVFLIITLVQFIVVAKGAERVAEVSARFTLDAMPGKQMSIDADIRAGLLSVEEGKRRRQELQIESRFYGALDGAMKFVKGDAVAGLVITAINVVGGILCGVIVEQMSIVQALDHFTLLTVGDGLLSQVPAFMNSLAAGVIVTRVARGDGISLASELPGQIADVKYAGVFTILLSLALTFIVGTPAILFIALPLGIAAIRATTEVRKQSQKLSSEPKVRFSLPSLCSLKIRLPAHVHSSNNFLTRLHNKLEKIRQDLFEELGILSEAPKLEFADSISKAQIFVFHTKAAEVSLDGDWEPVFESIMSEVLRVFRMDLLTDLHTRRLLGFYEETYPEIISQTIPDVLSVTQLTKVLKSLLKEDVPIRNFVLILQALAEGVSNGKGPDQLLEEVRIALGREISARVRGEEESLRCVTMDPEVDSEIGLSVIQGAQPGLILLDPLARSLAAVGSEVRAVICSRHSRLLLKNLLSSQGQQLPVLSYEEVVGQPLMVLGEVPLRHEKDAQDQTMESERVYEAA